jgi:hypothetical protein|tara:strand:+ start:193 stop:513 length:321 start_codon:yes stop_codon:yes gene_type:complete
MLDMGSAVMRHSVVTANRLRDGRVVYLAGCQGWSEDLSEATVAIGEEEMQELLIDAERERASGLVVAPYAFAVIRTEDAVAPLSQREKIRMQGPSILSPGSPGLAG